MSVDIILRAGSGIEARVVRDRMGAGRWTHVGILFKDGYVYACDAEHGVEKVENSVFSQSAKDIQHIPINVGYSEWPLQQWCDRHIKKEFDFSYSDWHPDIGVVRDHDESCMFDAPDGYYCTTFVLEALRNISKECRAIAPYLQDVHAKTHPVSLPMIGVRNLILPSYFINV